MGVCYSATLRDTGATYFGITMQEFHRRKARHLRDARRGIGYHFSRALAKHGADAFDWEVILRSDSKAYLVYVERYMIAMHRYLGTKLFNLTAGGDGFVGCEPPNKGVPMPEAAKAHLSKILKGRPSSNKGRKHTPEFCKLMSEIKTGTAYRLHGGKSVAQLAEEHGVSYTAMRKRLARGGTPALRREPIEVDGLTLHQWAEKLGLSYAAVLWRYRNKGHPTL